MKMKGNCGILYVATGTKYLAEAEWSARSVRRVSPEIPLAIVSDHSPLDSLFDIKIGISNPQFSYFDKIGPLVESPFENTIFLDTDTFAMKPLDEMFDLLNRFDIAAAADPGRYLYSIDGVPSAFPELNSGVILFKNNKRVLDVIRQWGEVYRTETELRASAGMIPLGDQLSFTTAIYRSSLNFLMLPPEFNARIIMPEAISGHIRIAHCRLKNPSRYETILGKLNKSDRPRNINPNPRLIPGMVWRTMSLFFGLQR